MNYELGVMNFRSTINEQLTTNMKVKNIVLIFLLMAYAWVAQAQGGSDFTIPLSDHAKRGREESTYPHEHIHL